MGISLVVVLALVVGWKETVFVKISSSTRKNVGNISQIYDSTARIFVTEINLSAPTSADGIKIVFSKVPSKNMGIAGDWQNFSLIIDGRKQVLIRDYNLYQSGKNVYVSFRNPINQTGRFQKAVFQYNNSDQPILDKVYILKKEFKPFGFFLKMLKLFGMSPHT